MAIGRTFSQAFAKALRSRELDKPPLPRGCSNEELLAGLETPTADRYEAILELLRRDVGIEPIHERTSIDPWFLRELERLAKDPDAPFAGERSFKSVDTCAAEFPARTPYYYSGWERQAAHEVTHAGREALGRDSRRRPQPHRPGHRVRLLLRPRRHDRARVGPRRGDDQLQPRDRLHRLRHLRPPLLRAAHARGRARRDRGRANLEGVIVQFGGQTPLKLAAGLVEAGVPLLGTSVEAIDLAEDRGRFGDLLERLGYQAPPYATACSVSEALEKAQDVGYPLLVRPSYVLGGRAMEIVYSTDGLADYLRREAPAGDANADHAHSARRRRSRNATHRTPRRGHVPPSSWTASSRTPSRWTSTRSATAMRCGSAGSCNTSRRPAFTPATAPASCRRTRSARRCSSRSAPPPATSRSGSASWDCSTSSTPSTTVGCM